MMPVYWPNGSLSIPRVTSEYNPARKNPVTGIVQPHNGIDLVGWADVCSPVDGLVIFAGYNGGAGNEVRIRADGPTAFHVGDVFRLMHHASLYVRTGQRVTAKQAVGRMGTTGNSTGIHCHFETHEFRLGNPINPRDFMARANASTAGGGSAAVPAPGGDDMGKIDNTEENRILVESWMRKAVQDGMLELLQNGTNNKNDPDGGFSLVREGIFGQKLQAMDADGKLLFHKSQDEPSVHVTENTGLPVRYTVAGLLASTAAQALAIRKTGVPVTLDDKALSDLAAKISAGVKAGATKADVEAAVKSALGSLVLKSSS